MDLHSQEAAVDWSGLAIGEPLTVVKLSPNGSEAARYEGVVIGRVDRGEWLVVQATWTLRQIAFDGLAFRPGDRLVEWFSPQHDFNAFALHAPEGAFKGWYANVTYPPKLDVVATPPALVWQDLYVDLVGFSDGTAVVRDEDELEASGLRLAHPQLHRRIVQARDELRGRFERRQIPFCLEVAPTELRR